MMITWFWFLRGSNDLNEIIFGQLKIFWQHRQAAHPFDEFNEHHQLRVAQVSKVCSILETHEVS
jgi:hypothetical protein